MTKHPVSMVATPAPPSFQQHELDLSDAAAQERLWREYAPLVWRVCSLHLSREDAEDAAADTFVEMVRTFATFDPSRGTFRGWVTGLAVTQVRRRWRSRDRLEGLVRRARQHETAAGFLECDAIIDRIDAERFRPALAALSRNDQLVLVVSAAADLEAGELGAALGVRAGAAKVRLHRARRRFERAARELGLTDDDRSER